MHPFVKGAFSRSPSRGGGESRRRGRKERPAGHRTARIGLERLEDRVVPSCDCYADLFAGPRLASVHTNQSLLLEGVFNAVLPGSYVDLDVLDWNAIAAGKVRLSSFINVLKADLGLSTTSQVLDANLTLAQV